jgi:hypothetical protein
LAWNVLLRRIRGDDNMGAATSAGIGATITEEPLRVTLLELVEAISDITNTEAEVVDTVIYMIETGRVRLSGSFRDLPISAICCGTTS